MTGKARSRTPWRSCSPGSRTARSRAVALGGNLGGLIKFARDRWHIGLHHLVWGEYCLNLRRQILACIDRGWLTVHSVEKGEETGTTGRLKAMSGRDAWVILIDIRAGVRVLGEIKRPELGFFGPKRRMPRWQ